jgi:type VI secretion system protein ImpF
MLAAGDANDAAVPGAGRRPVFAPIGPRQATARSADDAAADHRFQGMEARPQVPTGQAPTNDRKREMKGFEPSLLEKLFDDEPKSASAGRIFKSISVDQYKESVARDLEGLLNSRAAFTEDELKSFPNCQRSLMTFGLRDFSALSLANAFDRAAICRSLEQSIARHEPRLHNVRVALENHARSAGGLRFAIHGLLDLHPAREAISFDAMLQPNTLQYSVVRQRRVAAV